MNRKTKSILLVLDDHIEDGLTAAEIQARTNISACGLYIRLFWLEEKGRIISERLATGARRYKLHGRKLSGEA